MEQFINALPLLTIIILLIYMIFKCIGNIMYDDSDDIKSIFK